MYDFQKANMWKRISAWLFDFILIGIVIVGAACLFNLVLRYDKQCERVDQALVDFYDAYEQKHGIHLNMEKYDNERFNELYKTDEEKQAYFSAVEKEKETVEKNIRSDTELLTLYDKYSSLKYIVDNLFLVLITLSVMTGFLIMEFIIPLIFKNGQTLGKKIFGIGVMRTDGVKITPIQLFLRSIFGKCTLETLVPVYLLIMLMSQILGLVGIVIFVAIVLLEIVLLFATKARTPVHDIMSGTVTVDFASQMIFDSPEELLAYKQSLHKDTVNSQREEKPDGLNTNL